MLRVSRSRRRSRAKMQKENASRQDVTEHQSGYQDLCKPCFRKKHPRQYAAKVEGRKKTCAHCLEKKELSGEFCRPCRRARSCSECGAVNVKKTAKVCCNCKDLRANLGAVQSRLALWCLVCTSASDRSLGLCKQCLDDRREQERSIQEGQCDHCKRVGMGLPHELRCSESSCRITIHLCGQCVALTRGQEKMQCGFC